MNDHSRNASSFTLIYSSKEDEGIRKAKEIISKLSESSQTKDIIWVNPSQESDPERPKSDAFRITAGAQAGTESPIDLYSEIAASGALERVDLFTCCTFEASPKCQEPLNKEVRRLINYLQGLVPGNTTVNDKRIFFPEFGSLSPEGDFFPDMGSTNLIVIPEDREFPQSIAFPFDDLQSPHQMDRFAWHMAGEILSHTGLWITMEDHLLVDSEVTSGGNISAQLTRSFVRSAVSTSMTPDNLLDLETNLPTPQDHDLAPNYLHAVHTVADDVYPEVFVTPDLEHFDPITRIEGWKIITHVFRRIFKDLRDLPATLKDGFHSQLDEIVNRTATELVGENSWVKPLWEETEEIAIDNDRVSEVENLVDQLNAGRELTTAASFDPEAWNRMLKRTLGSIDGSYDNYFHDAKTVVVKRSALTPETNADDLLSVLSVLDAESQDTTLDTDTDTDTTINSSVEKTGSPHNQENLLSLIINKFDEEKQRIYDRIDSCLTRLKNIKKPSSEDRSGITTYIQWFFIGSIVIFLLAITTLVEPVRENLDFGFLDSETRTILFLVLSALIAIPIILLFSPTNKEKSGPYLIISFTGLAGLTTFLGIKANWLATKATRGGLIEKLLKEIGNAGAWIASILIVALLCWGLIKGIKRSDSNSLAKLGKKILYIMGPFYLIVIYIFSFSHGTKNAKYIADWVESIINADGILLTISLVISGVAFITSATILSVNKMQDELSSNLYREESEWLINNIREDSRRYRELSMLRIHWLGTSAVLHRLINNPFGDLKNSKQTTIFRPVGSEELLKTKTLDLNLTDTGKAAFLKEAIPDLTPPGWLTKQYDRTSKAFTENSEMNFSGQTPPELCSFPFTSMEDATNKKDIRGKGTRWPFAHHFFDSDSAQESNPESIPNNLDRVLRDSADESLADTLLATYINIDNSWVAQDGRGNTIRLQELFEQIASLPENPPHFAMGMFGTAAGLFDGTSEMTPLSVWPNEIVDLPSAAGNPTAWAPHQRVGNSIIFQAVRLDISGPIDLNQMRPFGNPSGGPNPRSGPEDNGDDGSSLFGGD